MAATVTFGLYCDLNNDGDYADANEDLSAYWMDLFWQIGFAKAFDPIARDSTGKIVLKNSDKRFSPEHGSALAGFTKGRRIKITVTYSAVTYTLYVGKIDEIKPAFGPRGTRRCDVTCKGFFDQAQAAECFISIQEGKTADQVVDAILNGGGAVFPPGIPLRCLLDITGWCELDTNAYLGSVTDYLTAEVGKTTFAYIADQWTGSVSLLGALRDTVGREMGRLFVDRSGLLVFWNRHHFIYDYVSDETFNNTLRGMDYVFGSEVINQATVKARPRKVGSAPEILGVVNGAKQIEVGAAEVVTFRYGDPSNSVRFGGRNAITPVASTDYTANTNEDGSGTDKTANVSVTISGETATKCDVTYTNNAGVVVWVQSGMQVRGTRITYYGESSETVEDVSSRGSYGLLSYTSPFIADNLQDAKGFAEYKVYSQKDPRGDVARVKIKPFRSSTLTLAACRRTIGDRVTLIDDQTGVNGDFFILGEIHHVRPGIMWDVDWVVESAEANKFCVLDAVGLAELDTNAVVGPL